MEMEKMFESMDIEQEQKIALQEAFDKAVLVKTTDLMETYVEEKVNEKVEVLEEEYNEKVETLTESLDGYLDTVVDEFIQENAPMYEAQIDEEKTKTLLEMFDNMAKVIGVDMIDIKEAKDKRDAEAFNESAEHKVEELEQKMSVLADKLVESKREADKYLKDGLISELAKDLSILEADKFSKLADMVNFERGQGYLDKLETLKESIIDSRSEDYIQPTELPSAAFKQPEQVSAKSALDFGKYV